MTRAAIKTLMLEKLADNNPKKHSGTPLFLLPPSQRLLRVVFNDNHCIRENYCLEYSGSTVLTIFTTIHFFLLLFCCVEGITVGTHRLWSHRTFKTKLPLRILLAFFQTLTVQKEIRGLGERHGLDGRHDSKKIGTDKETEYCCDSLLLVY
jgi:fatty-acid desaturase